MARETLTHNEWYRVAPARPRLRSDLTVNFHLYRGSPWYVLSDASGKKVHRVTPAAYAFVGRLDGNRDVETLWRALLEEMDGDAPTQGEIIDLLTKLYHADLLAADSRPLIDELLERGDKERRQALKKILFNPLSATLPLFDPDRLLRFVTAFTARVPSFVWWCGLLALLITTLPLLPQAWPALKSRGFEGVLDLENLTLIAFIYPVVKALHELGHGIAVRSRGGEVHEMGLMFIAFFPIPYVDASASLAFPAARSRAAVAAAGIAVELAIAVVAFHVWRLSEPGTLRSIAYNTLLIAGFSTLAVNGNPLLRFDGYHVMCDLIGIPDLGRRANAWWGEVFRVHALGTHEPDRRPTTLFERIVFFVYAPAAFAYRIVISLTIALFVATTYRFVGMLLAAWSLIQALVWPALKTIHQGLRDPRIRMAGPRAARVTVLLGALAGLAFFVLPLPDRILVEGAVWLPREAFVRPRESGTISEVLARAGSAVTPGEELFRLDAPRVAVARERAAARLTRQQAMLDAARFDDLAKAESLRADLAEARSRYEDAVRHDADLVLKAATAGKLQSDPASDSVGRWVRSGELLAYILPEGDPVIRAVLPQVAAQRVHEELRGVELRFADDMGTVHSAHIAREIPGGTDELPSAVFSLSGGGRIATLGNSDQLKTVEPVFIFDVELDATPARSERYGMRTFIRLDLEPKPLALQLYHALRQTFLSRFEI